MNISFPLNLIMNIHFLDELMSNFYEDTGNKLKISFNGSKGYLSYLEFECEGVQSDIDSRRIFLRRFETLNKDGSIKKKLLVKLSHEKETGLRIELN